MAAKSSASRRLQALSVPVVVEDCAVQFVAVPASSDAVVTTRFGALTVIEPVRPAIEEVTVSVAVMVCVPGVFSVA